MTKEEFLVKDMEIRLKIALLSPNEKCNSDHPLYKELKDLKKEYTLSLIKERESEKYGQHKRK